MNLPFRVSVFGLLTVDGRKYKLDRKTDFGYQFEDFDETGRNLSLTFDEFADLLQRPDVTFDPGYYLPERQDVRMSAGVEAIASLPDDVRSEVVWRFSWVDGFYQFERVDEAKRTDFSLQSAIPSIEAHVNKQARAAQSNWRNPRAGKKNVFRDPPSPRTLREWVKRYEKAGGSPLGLIPGTHRSGNRTARFCLEASRLLGECLEAYLTRKRLTKKNVADVCRDRFKAVNEQRVVEGKPELTIPSRRKVERALSELDPYFTCVQRHGVDYANRKFALYEEGVTASYPMERVEIDEWCVDLITILAERGALDHLSPEELAKLDRGRRWLYLAIDCATRCVVGMRLAEKPNCQDAMALLSDITRDKSDLAIAAGCKSTWHHYGGVSSLVTDLGVAFVDDAFRSAVFDAHGVVETPRGGLPRLRGRVERIFRTFGTALMPLLAGRTFSDPKERGDYPSEEMASLSDDVLMEILIRFVVDVYHNMPHRGLNGETPNNCWNRLAEKMGIVPQLAETTRRKAFGVGYRRRVFGKGVRLFGIDYTCQALREFYVHDRRRHVHIKVDLNDLGWIMIQIGKKWYAARALQKCFDAVSYEQWEATARQLRLKYKAEAVLQEKTVSDALHAIIQKNSEEERRFGAVLKRQTPAGLRRAREDLFLGLSIETDDPEGFDLPPEPDLFGHVIPSLDEGEDTTEVTVDQGQSPTGDRPRPSKWRIEND